jgi:phenylacetate-coenzyme A ligase PaaK-like adenylate-forming protein
VLTGGGWKNHKGEIIGRQEFARFIERISGIPARNVRDLFGLSEHGVGYVDCEAGRLHVPVYAHAVTRDVYTLELQPPGRLGMLQLFSPILRTVPTLSLLTTDQVVLDDRPCACGRPGMGWSTSAGSASRSTRGAPFAHSTT